MLMNGHYRAEMRGGSSRREAGGEDGGLGGLVGEGTQGAAAGGGKKEGFNFHLRVL